MTSSLYILGDKVGDRDRAGGGGGGGGGGREKKIHVYTIFRHINCFALR